MTEWHIYRLVDGRILGRTFTTVSSDLEDPMVSTVLAANTPPGHGVICGVADRESQQVDTATGELTDWQPPSPPGDEMRTWSWHAGARRWIPVPTLAALLAKRLAEVQLAIEAAEARQARPARELSLAAAQGHPVPVAALGRLQQLDAEIAWLRTYRAELEGASSAEELAAIPSLVEVTRP